MDTGLAGPPGARALRHVATARGAEAELVLKPPLSTVTILVLEVVRTTAFAIYVIVQVKPI